MSGSQPVIDFLRWVNTSTFKNKIEASLQKPHRTWLHLYSAWGKWYYGDSRKTSSHHVWEEGDEHMEHRGLLWQWSYSNDSSDRKSDSKVVNTWHCTIA
jgi:hypothetical protein